MTDWSGWELEVVLRLGLALKAAAEGEVDEDGPGGGPASGAGWSSWAGGAATRGERGKDSPAVVASDKGWELISVDRPSSVAAPLLIRAPPASSVSAFVVALVVVVAAVVVCDRVCACVSAGKERLSRAIAHGTDAQSGVLTLGVLTDTCGPPAFERNSDVLNMPRDVAGRASGEGARRRRGKKGYGAEARSWLGRK